MFGLAVVFIATACARDDSDRRAPATAAPAPASVASATRAATPPPKPEDPADLAPPPSRVVADDTTPPRVLVAADVCEAPQIGQPVPFFRGVGVCDEHCDLAPVQCLGANKPSELATCLLAPPIASRVTDIRPQLDSWKRLAGRLGGPKCDTPVRSTVERWLTSQGGLEAYDVLVLWFDGMIDNDNDNEIIGDADADRLGGAWVIAGTVGGRDPLVAYVLARPGKEAGGRRVAEGIATAKRAEVRLAPGSPLELYPGRAARYRAVFDRSAAPHLKGDGAAELKWIASGSTGQPQQLRLGEPVDLPGAVVVPAPERNAALPRASWLVGQLDAGRAALGGLSARLSVEQLPPAALAASGLEGLADPESFNVPADAAAGSAPLPLNPNHESSDLRQPVVYGGACVPTEPGVREWVFGAFLPCEPPDTAAHPKSDGVPVFTTCGAVNAASLNGVFGKLRSLLDGPAGGSCRVRAGLVPAGSGALTHALMLRRQTSSLSVQGSVPEACMAPGGIVEQTAAGWQARITERQAACPARLWKYLDGLLADRAFASAFEKRLFRQKTGGQVTNLVALDGVRLLAWRLGKRALADWQARSELLRIHLEPPPVAR